MLRLVGCLLLVVLAASLGYAQAQEQPPGEGPQGPEEPAAQLSRQQTLAPTQSESTEEARRRTQAVRGLIWMVILTLVLIALLLILMVLTARWARYRFVVGRGRPEPTTLEDLWWRVKEETLPKVDIDELMSEGGDQEEKDPQEDEDPQKG